MEPFVRILHNITAAESFLAASSMLFEEKHLEDLPEGRLLCVSTPQGPLRWDPSSGSFIPKL